MILRRVFLSSLSVAALLAATLAYAQDPPPEVVIPPENVRYDYAQVLGVKPIYQVLRTTSTERVCDVTQPGDSKLSRVVSSVKGRLSGNATPEERKAGMWDPLESTCRHASLSIL